MRLLKMISVIFCCIAILVVMALMRPIEYRHIDSPDGRHYAIVTYRFYHNLIPAMPGNASDKPGKVTMYTAEGDPLGAIPVPMISLGTDIEWEASKASLTLIGEWDFVQKTVSYWNDNQTELVVKQVN